jgi:hypothetical protein
MAKPIVQCVVCNSRCGEYVFAVISPWIRELGIKSSLSRYFLCDTCGTGFFTKRYNASEMSSIYTNYRATHYLNVRSKWEPWYTTSYNANHDSDNWINNRKDALEDFLNTFGSTSYTTIIDVGGDRGQYIPNLGTKRIVFDISSKDTVHGVIRITDFDELPTSDLVIYAHVLEHVADPFEEIKKLFSKSKNVYIEVPYGVPEINRSRRNKFKLLIHLACSQSQLLWGARTHASTGRKVNSTRMLTQSEHLTFFSEKSLRFLASRLGATVVIEKKSISTPDLSTGMVLQCLYSLPPDATLNSG